MCAQVGCGSAVSALRKAFFGEGAGPIWLDNVRCSSDDETLQECRHRGWGIHNCQHREDAGIICECIAIHIFDETL